MSELLPGRLLLIRAKLEVLGGQFETQRVGSQWVNHVLVAFPAVLHEERTPVGLGRAHQLQTLQRSNRSTMRSCPETTGEQSQRANYYQWQLVLIEWWKWDKKGVVICILTGFSAVLLPVNVGCF